jgi:putative transposase
MKKNARNSEHLQLVDEPATATVEIPLPILSAYGSIERSFFELCVNAGQQVLSAMMEQDRDHLCGPRWQRDPDRKAGRAGTTRSEVTLGGRRIAITRPRARSVEGAELELPSFAFATSRDALDRRTVEAVACGVSGRKYARSLDPLPDGTAERSVSKSSVSRRYVALTTKQMTKWLTKPITGQHFPVIMIDGIVLGDHTALIALGIDSEGKKQVLGLREGSTENGQVAKALLRDIVARGLDQERARLFVIDGAKALRSAVRMIFGDLGVVQRCQIHKQRNVIGHLPDGMHESVRTILKEAWSLTDSKLAKTRIERLASSLEADHPGAAASVLEGLDETLTLQSLGIKGTLYRKLRSTNAIENLNSGIATYSKNVKRWQGGSMVLRWVSAAVVEAEKKFRRVHGWRDIEKLARALSLVEDKEEAVAERVA